MTDQERPATPDADPGTGDGGPPTPLESTDLVKYLAAHRDRYTREALNDYLRRTGHDDGDIAAAWVEVDARDAPAATDSEMPARPRQTVLVLLAILFALAAFLVGEWGILAGSRDRPMMTLYAILFPLQIVLVTRWLTRRIETSSSLRAGEWFMTIGWLVIPPVAMLALIGICFGYSLSFGCYLNC